MSIPDCPFSDGWTDEEIEDMRDRHDKSPTAKLGRVLAYLNEQEEPRNHDALEVISRAWSRAVVEEGRAVRAKATENQAARTKWNLKLAAAADRTGLSLWEAQERIWVHDIRRLLTGEAADHADILGALKTARELLRGDHIFEETFAEEIEQIDAAIRKADTVA